MKIKDFMIERVIKISEDTTLGEAAELLVRHNVSGLPVVDSSDKLMGVVSEKDIFRTLYPNFQDIITDAKLWLLSKEKIHDGFLAKKDIPVERIMTEKVITVEPGDSILKTGSLMLMNNIHRFPVVDKQGRLVGIVTRRDIFRRLIKTGIE